MRPECDLAGWQAGEVGADHSTQRRDHTAKTPRKWQRVLAAFVRGESLNRFDAERRYHDHCLHSTAATIQSKGIRIERRDETVPGFQKIPTHVCRYWLASDQRQAALNLLGKASVSTDAENTLAGLL